MGRSVFRHGYRGRRAGDRFALYTGQPEERRPTMSEQNDEERDNAADTAGGTDKVDTGGYGGPGPEEEAAAADASKSDDDG